MNLRTQYPAAGERVLIQLSLQALERAPVDAVEVDGEHHLSLGRPRRLVDGARQVRAVIRVQFDGGHVQPLRPREQHNGWPVLALRAGEGDLLPLTVCAADRVPAPVQHELESRLQLVALQARTRTWRREPWFQRIGSTSTSNQRPLIKSRSRASTGAPQSR